MKKKNSTLAYEAIKPLLDTNPFEGNSDASEGHLRALESILQVASEYDSPDEVAERLTDFLDNGPVHPEGSNEGIVKAYQDALEALGKNVPPGRMQDEEAPFKPKMVSPEFLAPRRDPSVNPIQSPSPTPPGEGGIGSWMPGGNTMHGRLEPQGAWKEASEQDVRNKGQEIYSNGGVQLASFNPNPDGDLIDWQFNVNSTSGETYQPYGTTPYTNPNAWNDYHDCHCTCPYEQYRFQRTDGWTPQEGLPCSHLRACDFWLNDNGGAQVKQYEQELQVQEDQQIQQYPNTQSPQEQNLPQGQEVMPPQEESPPQQFQPNSTQPQQEEYVPDQQQYMPQQLNPTNQPVQNPQYQPIQAPQYQAYEDAAQNMLPPPFPDYTPWYRQRPAASLIKEVKYPNREEPHGFWRC